MIPPSVVGAVVGSNGAFLRPRPRLGGAAAASAAPGDAREPSGRSLCRDQRAVVLVAAGETDQAAADELVRTVVADGHLVVEVSFRHAHVVRGPDRPDGLVGADSVGEAGLLASRSHQGLDLTHAFWAPGWQGTDIETRRDPPEVRDSEVDAWRRKLSSEPTGFVVRGASGTRGLVGLGSF